MLPARGPRILPSDSVGAGEPVVLVHAGVADRSMWRETLPALAGAGFRGVAVDLPGFGEAPIVPGPQAPWDDVLHTMRALGLPGAHLVGISFGAAVTLRMAVIAPASARSLTLVSPSAPGAEPSPALLAAGEAEDAALERGDTEAALDAILDAWTLPDGDPAVRERVRAMSRRGYELQATVAEADAPAAPDPLDRRPRALAELATTVLTIAGGRDMPDFRDGAASIAAAVPRGECVVIPAAGHLPPLETRDAFHAVLLGFLGRAGRPRSR